MTPEHLPIDQYDAQLAEKTERLQSMMAPFAAPAPEVFRSPVSHYRMRAEFRLWHDGDDLYHIIFDQETRSRIRVDSFPAASELINALMPRMIAGIRDNRTLRHKLFQIDYLTTRSQQAVVSLLYHRALDDAWREEATRLRDALRARGLRRPLHWPRDENQNHARSGLHRRAPAGRGHRDDLPPGGEQLYPAERGDEHSYAGMGAGCHAGFKGRSAGALLR
ncbi:tRNA (Uracil54-C5-)-methyltransferase [Cronobacter sakazakii 701]|nr:tRNA (Uracil54-C5-)-methyltransferase [Cronobacter sakazakii 701]